MNNNLSSSGSTRRSFIKKSVVAAVAVSSMTIFSGLVNAATANGVYHREVTCNGGSISDQAVYLDSEMLDADHSQCWKHVICNGVDYYTGHTPCPTAAEDYPKWYSCVQREIKRIPDDWPLCIMGSGIQ